MKKNAFLQDFKAFALKGNVLDMAVGVIIGGAFGKIVSSLVRVFIGGRHHHAPDRPAGRRSELHGFEVGDETRRSGKREGSGCCRHAELRQLLASDFRFPDHRFLYFHVHQAPHTAHHP